MKVCTRCKENKPLNAFYKRKDRKNMHSSECKLCFKERMSHRHQQHKDILVEEFGGKCTKCGYNKCTRILQFHHTDSSTKDFGISKKLSSNLSVLRKEAQKCILLCPTCHAEKHQGLW